jgi:hypothetical protein
MFATEKNLANFSNNDNSSSKQILGYCSNDAKDLLIYLKGEAIA